MDSTSEILVFFPWGGPAAADVLTEASRSPGCNAQKHVWRMEKRSGHVAHKIATQTNTHTESHIPSPTRRRDFIRNAGPKSFSSFIFYFPSIRNTTFMPLSTFFTISNRLVASEYNLLKKSSTTFMSLSAFTISNRVLSKFTAISDNRDWKENVRRCSPATDQKNTLVSWEADRKWSSDAQATAVTAFVCFSKDCTGRELREAGGRVMDARIIAGSLVISATALREQSGFAEFSFQNSTNPDCSRRASSLRRKTGNPATDWGSPTPPPEKRLAVRLGGHRSTGSGPIAIETTPYRRPTA